MSSQSLRVAVIGYGGAFNMGRQHLTQMQEAGMTPVAACDVDPVRVAAAEADFPGLRGYTDYRELLQSPEVDLVTVILPHDLHAPVSIACSEAGKHVVVEKPMCNTVAEADAMIAAAAGAGKVLSIYHNRRYDEDFRCIKSLLEEGLIGEVFRIECAIGGYGKPPEWWRSYKAKTGSALHDWGAHFFDWILALVPSEVTSVFGVVHEGHWGVGDIEDHVEAMARFANGAVASVEVSSLNSIHKPKWRILGTKGGISVEWGDKLTVKVEHAGRMATFEQRPSKVPFTFYRSVADHIANGSPLDVRAEEARRNIAVIEAAEQSWKTGVSVTPKYS